MKTFRMSCTCLFLILLLPAALAQSPVQKAKQFFSRYTALESTFNPSVADLYANTALVRNTRLYPNGTTRTLTFPAPQYKTLMRQVMPLAKARGDKNRYSNVRYTSVGSKVRITATRYNLMKKYASPASWLVGPDPSHPKGSWIIYEEISESRP